MKRVLLVLLLLLAGCGGSSSPGGAGANPGGTSSGGSSSAPAAPTARGLAVSLSIKQVPGDSLHRGEDISEVLLDVLDPSTLRAVTPTTRVVREPGAVTQRATISVPNGNWLFRAQGRTLLGEPSGSRYQAPVTVSPDTVTVVNAELNPLTDLVGLTVNPFPTAALALGTTRQYTAVGVRSDQTLENVTNNVIWSSSNPAVASVSATGVVNATGEGTAVITGRATPQLSAQATVVVSRTELRQIQVEPPSLTLSPGLTRQYRATGIYSDNSHQDVTNQVTWRSSAANLAAVTPTGLVLAVAPGNVTITAQLGTVTGTGQLQVQATLTRIDVSPASAELPAGKTQQLRATGVFSDNTTQDLTASVIWSSGNETVAQVSATGLVTSRTPGQARIEARSGSVSAGSNVTVKPAVVVSLAVTPGNLTVPAGSSSQLRAVATFSDGSSRDVTETTTWTTTNAGVAGVSNVNGTRGLVTGVAAGQAVVEATQDGVSNSATVSVTGASLTSLEVRPANSSLAVGSTIQYQAFGRFSDNSVLDLTQNVTWTSADPNLASISNANGTQGLATALALGTTTIQAVNPLAGQSTATNLTIVAGGGGGGGGGPVPTPTPTPPPPAGNVTLISRRDAVNFPPAGPGNGNSNSSLAQSMSSDGKYVVFISAASDLVVGDTNGVADAFRFDTATNTMIRVSVDNAGGQLSAATFDCSVSADGRYVAFSTDAAIDANDTNGLTDVYRRDTLGPGATVGVSCVHGTSNTFSTGFGQSLKAVISGAGDKVVFQSTNTDLTPGFGDTNGTTDVYVRVLGTNQTLLVSRAFGSTNAGGGASNEGTINLTGTHVAFTSTATDLLAVADTNPGSDVFRFNLTGLLMQLVSTDGTGGYPTGPAAGSCAAPTISGDGRYIAFQADGQLLATDTNGFADIYRRDMNSNARVLVSVNSAGTPSTLSPSINAGISEDGRWVVFDSVATDLQPDKGEVGVAGGGVRQVFVRDITNGLTRIVSLNAANTEANLNANLARISSDGMFVSFQSPATNLDPLKTGGGLDVFRNVNVLWDGGISADR